jgi:hypothetical protein
VLSSSPVSPPPPLVSSPPDAVPVVLPGGHKGQPGWQKGAPAKSSR